MLSTSSGSLILRTTLNVKSSRWTFGKDSRYPAKANTNTETINNNREKPGFFFIGSFLSLVEVNELGVLGIVTGWVCLSRRFETKACDAVVTVITVIIDFTYV